jgi:hypothetical protein
MMLSCAVVCALLLAFAYAAAAVSDALETRVSLVSAAGGETLALGARPAAGRTALPRTPRGVR